VVSSAAEAEIAAIFINTKEAIPIRQTLIEMGHPQPATNVITDNATASKILNNSCKQIRSKAIDMRYYWVKDRIQQKQFILEWKPGKYNKGDFYTKRHPPIHYKKMRPVYLYISNNKNMPQTQSQQGCVEEQTVLLKNILPPKATKISYPVNKTGGKTHKPDSVQNLDSNHKL